METPNTREPAYELEETDADLVPVRSADRCGKGRWRWWLALAAAILLVIIIAAVGFNKYDPYVPLPPAVFLCRTVQGSWMGGLAVFHGVPFGVAERWQLPQPAPCWAGTFDASKPGPVCPQFHPKPLLNESEQCLNMNVWTSNLQSTRTPVPIIFFLHGGSNVIGTNDVYSNLGSFALSNRVCVFSPNFRLGVFGFLSLAELSAQDPRNTSGNYAIEDIRLALRWTKQFAAPFGCDANKITLMGQSSGATNIFALLSNPDNKGLFRGAIALSGSANITQSLETAQLQGREVITNAHCEGPNPLACLRNLSMNEVRAAMPASWASTSFWPTSPNGLSNPGLLTVDGVTVRTDFASAMAQSLVDVPLLLQSARADLILFPRRDVLEMNASQLALTWRSNFQSWPNNETGQYLSSAYDKSANASVLRAWGELTTDLMMYCAHVELASRSLLPRTRRSPIFVSVVDQPPSNPVTFPSPDDCPPNRKDDPSCASVLFQVTEPFHVWDYMVAARAWSQVETSRTQRYIPTAADEKLGDLLSSQWLDFATGSSYNQSAFDSVDFPSSFAVNVQGDAHFSGTSKVVPNYRSSFCQLLKDMDLNPDSRFWLVN